MVHNLKKILYNIGAIILLLGNLLEFKLFLQLIFLVLNNIINIIVIYFFYFKILWLLLVKYLVTFISKLLKFIIIGIISIMFVWITSSGQKSHSKKNLESILNEFNILESINDKFYFNKWLWFIESTCYEIIQCCKSKCLVVLYKLKKEKDLIILKVKQPSFLIIIIIMTCLILLLILHFKLTVIEPRNYLNWSCNYFFIKFAMFYQISSQMSTDAVKIVLYPPLIDISSFVSVPFIWLVANIILFIFLIICFTFQNVIFNSDYKFIFDLRKGYKLCLCVFFLSWILFIPVLFTLYLFWYDKYLWYIYWVQADWSYFELFKIKNLNFLNFFFKSDIWFDEKKVLMEYLKDTDIAYNEYIPNFCQEISVEYIDVLKKLIPHYTFHFDEDINLEKVKGGHTDMRNIWFMFEDVEDFKPYMDICDFQFIEKFENKYIHLFNEILNVNVYNRALWAWEKFGSNNLNENYKQYKILYSIYKNDKGFFWYEVDSKKNWNMDKMYDMDNLTKYKCTQPAYDLYKQELWLFKGFRKGLYKYYSFVKNYVNMFHDFLELQKKAYFYVLNPENDFPIEIWDYGLNNLNLNILKFYFKIENFIAQYKIEPELSESEKCTPPYARYHTRFLKDLTLDVLPQFKIETYFTDQITNCELVKKMDDLINIKWNEKKNFQVISNPFFLNKYNVIPINIDRIYDMNLFKDRLANLDNTQYIFHNRYGFEGYKEFFYKLFKHLNDEIEKAKDEWLYENRHVHNALETCTNPETNELNDYQHNLWFDHKGKPTEYHPEYHINKYYKERAKPLLEIANDDYSVTKRYWFDLYEEYADELVWRKKCIRLNERELSIYEDKYVNFVIHDEDYYDFIKNRMCFLQQNIDFHKEEVINLKEMLFPVIFEYVEYKYIYTYILNDLYYDWDEELIYLDPVDYKNSQEFYAYHKKHYPIRRDMWAPDYEHRLQLWDRAFAIFSCDKDLFDYMLCKKKLHNLKISQYNIFDNIFPNYEYVYGDLNLIDWFGLVKEYYKDFYTNTPIPGLHTDYEGIYSYRLWPIKKTLEYWRITFMYKMLLQSQ